MEPASVSTFRLTSRRAVQLPPALCGSFEEGDLFKGPDFEVYFGCLPLSLSLSFIYISSQSGRLIDGRIAAITGRSVASHIRLSVQLTRLTGAIDVLMFHRRRTRKLSHQNLAVGGPKMANFISTTIHQRL